MAPSDSLSPSSPALGFTLGATGLAVACHLTGLVASKVGGAAAAGCGEPSRLP